MSLSWSNYAGKLNPQRYYYYVQSLLGGKYLPYKISIAVCAAARIRIFTGITISRINPCKIKQLHVLHRHLQGMATVRLKETSVMYCNIKTMRSIYRDNELDVGRTYCIILKRGHQQFNTGGLCFSRGVVELYFTLFPQQRDCFPWRQFFHFPGSHHGLFVWFQ